MRLYILFTNKKLKSNFILIGLQKTIMTDQRESDLSEFEALVSNHLKYHKSYSYRSVSIDGVLCYPVIHKHRKIVNIESVHIQCRMKNKWGDNKFEKYSLYYRKYRSIRDAILIIEEVISSYKIIDGDLVSPYDYKIAMVETKFNPYTDKQTCCVCYEKTMDTTICDHYLCMKCREICIRKEKPNCPMCRNPGIVNIYNIDNGLINNNEYKCIKEVNEFESENRNASSPEENVFISNRGFRFRAVIDRIGARRSPSNSSNENNDELQHGAVVFDEMVIMDENEDDELSEVSTIDEDDASDFIPFDLSVLFNNVTEEDLA